MDKLEQAEGLWKWGRYHELKDQEYLDEDESWEMWELERDLDIPKPPPIFYCARPFTYEEHLHHEGEQFMANIWAKEIVSGLKANLVMNQMVQRDDVVVVEQDILHIKKPPLK